MKILIVDDDAFSRKLLERSLKSSGHEVCAADSGENGLAALENDPNVTLLITDWIMPGMDGIELCRRARQLSRSHYLPVLLLTSRSDKEDLIQALNAGADAFLSKPLNLAELEAHLRVAGRILNLEEQLAAELANLQAAHLKLAEAHERIQQIAHTDELTQIPNRRSVMGVLEKEVERARRYSHSLSVAIFDIDHFKRVNDTHGHLAGDEVLREFARRIAGAVRSTDSIGRYGGEEFIAVLTETALPNAIVFAERVRAVVESTPFRVGQEEAQVNLKLTVSGGVSEYVPGETLELLVGRADDGLYRAKSEGRNRVCTSDAQAADVQT